MRGVVLASPRCPSSPALQMMDAPSQSLLKDVIIDSDVGMKHASLRCFVYVMVVSIRALD